MLDPGVIAGLSRSARNYRRGLCCPAVLWQELAYRLAGRDVPLMLTALPADLQAVLRECYRERALSLQALTPRDEIFGAIERWCQRAGA